jgi:polyisoprenoid-binding protein YceI
MFNLKPFIHAVALIAGFAVVSPSFAGTYVVDASHSSVGFTIRHLLAKVNGNFGDFAGELNFDPAKIESTTGSMTIKTASIDTNNGKRDEHLRAPDFFDATKNPEMSFVIKKVTAEKKDKKKFKIEGDFSMHGVTKKEVLTGEHLGTEKDPWGNTKAGFAITGKLSRKDYGITWNKTLDSGNVLLGDEVEVAINIEAGEKK